MKITTNVELDLQELEHLIRTGMAARGQGEFKKIEFLTSVQPKQSQFDDGPDIVKVTGVRLIDVEQSVPR